MKDKIVDTPEGPDTPGSDIPAESTKPLRLKIVVRDVAVMRALAKLSKVEENKSAYENVGKGWNKHTDVWPVFDDLPKSDIEVALLDADTGREVQGIGNIRLSITKTGKIKATIELTNPILDIQINPESDISSDEMLDLTPTTCITTKPPDLSHLLPSPPNYVFGAPAAGIHPTHTHSYWPSIAKNTGCNN